MIYWAGCRHNMEQCNELSVFSTLSKCHVFLFFFTVISVRFDILSQHWLVTAVSHQGGNTNYQSATATAASDKFLSDTLMPSNCLETPPCLLLIAHPCPTSSRATLPLHTSSTPYPHYCSIWVFFCLFFFLSLMPFQPRSPSYRVSLSKMSLGGSVIVPQVSDCPRDVIQ